MALKGFDQDYYQNNLLDYFVANFSAWQAEPKTVADIEAWLVDQGQTAEEHYMAQGWKYGISPNEYFDAEQYEKAYERAAGADAETITGNPYEHYLANSMAMDLNPSNAFDESDFLTDYLAYEHDTNGLEMTVAELRAALVDAADPTSDNFDEGFVGLTALTAYYMNPEAFAAIGVTPSAVTGDEVVTAPFTLTRDTDIASANVFNAPRGWDPEGDDQLNTLNDDDVLTGVGENPTLNFTYVTDADTGDLDISPTLNGIETINISADLSAPAQLDLQDATGVAHLNLSRIDNNFQVDGLQDTPETISLTNSNEVNAIVIFDLLNSAASAADDATELTLHNANLAQITLEETTGNNQDQGVETLNLVSTGSDNYLGIYRGEDLETLNITGDQSLTLGTENVVVNAVTGVDEAVNYAAALNNVTGSLDTINANVTDKVFTGNLDITLGAELNGTRDNTSGVAIEMAVSGGTGDDVFRIANGTNINAAANNTDTIAAGDGADKLVVQGNTVIAANAAGPNITSVEALEIRTGQDNELLVTADVATIDADAFDALETIFVRNEGQQLINIGTAAAPVWQLQSIAEGMTTNLNDLNATQAAGITLAHGTTGNNGIAGNILNAALKTATGTTDLFGITIVDGTNSDPRFNAQLNAPAMENVTLADDDTESNTFAFTSVANHTGIVTLTGGELGDFINLDTTTTGLNGGIYLYDTTGLNDGPNDDTTLGRIFDQSLTAGQVKFASTTIDASAELSDVIVRVSSNAASAVGAQTISLGAGDDTVIFDNANDNRAGLTISDVVNADSATVVGDTAATDDSATSNDTLVIDGNLAVAGTIALGASEWTNVAGFENIRLVNPGAGSTYALTLTDSLIANNNDAVINADGTVSQGLLAIVNDHDAFNDTARSTAAAGALPLLNNDVWNGANQVEANVVIDARSLTANSHFSYDGEEGVSRTADRFIFSDVNINGGTAIDGGAIDNITDNRGLITAANPNGNGLLYSYGNADVLEVRNSAVVSQGDLAQISNVGTISFTNDLAVTQTSNLQLNDDIIDAMVDSYQASSSTVNIETLRVNAIDNMNVAGATTGLTVEAGTLTAKTSLDIALGRGANVVATGAGNDLVYMLGNYNTGVYVGPVVAGVNVDDQANNTAGARAVTDSINMGDGFDRLVSFGAVNLAAATFAGIEAYTAFSDVTIRASQLAAFEMTFDGTENHTLTIIDDLGPGEALDFSNINLEGTGTLTVTTNGTPFINSIDVADGAGEVTIDGEALDTTPPVFVSAEVDGAILTLNYNEALNAAAAPVVANFDVTVDGTSVDIAAVTLNGTEVVLTLGTPVAEGVDVTVTYTDPTENNDALAIQDAAGNDASTLENQMVVNSTVTNVAPVAGNDTDAFTADYQTPTTINVSDLLVNDNDADGDDLTITVNPTSANGGTVTIADQGTAAISDDVITFTPAAGFDGADSFQYRLNDGTVNSNVATVSGIVNPPPGIAVNDSDFTGGVYNALAGAEVITIDLADWTSTFTINGFDATQDELVINSEGTYGSAAAFIAANIAGEPGTWGWDGGGNAHLYNSDFNEVALVGITGTAGTESVGDAETAGWLTFV